MKKFNWMLNALTLVAMALALVMTPTAPASADVAAVTDLSVTGPVPCNIGSEAYYRVDFRMISAVEPGTDYLAIRFPGIPGVDGVQVPHDILTTSVSIAQAPLETGLDAAIGTYPVDIKYGTEFGNPWNEIRLFVGTAVNNWVKVEFYGPRWTDPATPAPPIPPDHTNARIVNPATQGEKIMTVWTSEESTPPATAPFNICLAPVQLYLKEQIPQADCGYTTLVPVMNFTTIGDALDAANDIWLQQGAYIDLVPKWNLFDGCPTLPGASGERGTGTFGGVYVGAVISVGPGTYTETLHVHVPGLILGSTDGRAVTIINADGETPVTIDGIPAAVAIDAGGVTFGKSEIITATDAFGDPGGSFKLYGFTVQDAGRNYVDDTLGSTNNDCDKDDDYWEDGQSDGIAVRPHGTNCDGVRVFSSTVVLSGTMSTIWDVPSVPTQKMVTKSPYSPAEYDKIVNLTTGWSAYVKSVSSGEATLVLTQPIENATPITVTDYFTGSDKFAIFQTDGYFCDDARVNIRDNEVKNSTFTGISAYSTAIWVDSNNVHNNDEDGFYGAELRCCGALVICDGVNPTDEMIEISENQFHENGNSGLHGFVDQAKLHTGCGWYMDADAGWLGADNCFKPAEGAGNDSGIEIKDTEACGEGLAQPFYIHDNQINTNVHAGMWLQIDAADCGIRILWNEILNNGVFGVSNKANADTRNDGEWEAVTTVEEVDVIFKYNDVTGNGDNVGDGVTLGTGWGVKNWAADYTPALYFNAKENFWNPTFYDNDDPPNPEMYPGGPSKGPAQCAHKLDQRSNAQGYGDAVSKGTFYNPWLSASYLGDTGVPGCDRRGDEGVRYYGSDSLVLQEGWNTLAVPIDLYDSANTEAEISALGTFFADMKLLYWYDAELDQYVNDPVSELVPARGYYVRMDAASKFPVLYDNTNQTPPAIQLEEGWNLIGSAFGIDRETGVYTFTWEDWECVTCDPITDTYNDLYDQGRWAVADPDLAVPDVFPPASADSNRDPEALMKASEALATIIWGNNEGAQLIVNPPVPGQIAPVWASSAENLEADMRYMYTGEAYWVFMNKEAMLGGFEAPALYHIPFPLPIK